MNPTEFPWVHEQKERKQLYFLKEIRNSFFSVILILGSLNCLDTVCRLAILLRDIKAAALDARCTD